MKNNRVFFEIFLHAILIAVISLCGYFFYLNGVISKNNLSRYSALKIENRLTHQKQLLIQEKETNKSLSYWKKQNGQLYQTAVQSHLLNQSIEKISKIANQLKFQIDEINPVVLKNKKIVKKEIHIKMTGDFLQIFPFVKAVDKIAIPLTIENLTANNKGKINLKIQVEG